MILPRKVEKRRLITIFAETHQIIASNIYDDVLEEYGLELNKNRLLWWSIAPDILPQYKLIRHYKEESIDYISREIIKIIYVSRYLDFSKGLDPFSITILSKKIGLISHYLSDYFCLPHANRWTFKDSMVKHVKYESDLEDFAKSHDFNKNMIDTDDIDIYEEDLTDLRTKIINYIDKVGEEYKKEESFSNDLNFALSINIKMTHFILDTIEEYSEELHNQFAFEL